MDIIKTIKDFIFGSRNQKINDLTFENIELNKIVKKLESKPQIEHILDLYYNNVTMHYKKRYILNHPKLKIPYDVRDFIYNDRVIEKFNNLQEIWNYKITYISDSNNIGYNEFWQFSEETYCLKKGDCEDSSIFRINASRQHTKETALALGMYRSNKDTDWNKATGHAFPIWYNGGKLYILEATTNKFKPIYIDEKTMENDNYKIFFVFNENQCWITNRGISFGKKIKSDFKIL